jgi:hypothetical protein
VTPVKSFTANYILLGLPSNHFKDFGRTNKGSSSDKVPYASHYNPRFVYFLPKPFLEVKTFFQKILSLCMVSIQEQFLLKSGL